MYVWFDALINYMSGVVPSSDENLHIEHAHMRVQSPLTVQVPKSNHLSVHQRCVMYVLGSCTTS